MPSIKDLIICWNSHSPIDKKICPKNVALVPYPDHHDLSCNYESTWGGCNQMVQNMTFEQRKCMVFIYATNLMVNYKIDPKVVHQTFLEIDEYIDGCPNDWPGVWKRRVNN